MTILALDQSTSATKAYLLDEAGRALAQSSIEHLSRYPRPGWVEQDAEELWQNTLHVLRTAAAAAPPNDPPAFLSIANQRETIVLFDRQSGRPLHPAIVWQCRRGADFCSAQIAAGRDAPTRARTGLRIDPYFSASKLQWLIHHHPDLATQLASGSALIGTIDTYLIYRLTNHTIFSTDATNASRTLLYDIHHRRWDDELCSWWDVPPRALPEVRDSSSDFGATTLGGALPRPLPIRGVMGDSQAALLAHHCESPGSAKITLGTGCSILLNIGSSPRADKDTLLALAWILHGRPAYAAEGLIVSAASALTYLRDALHLFTESAEAEPLASELPDNGGVYLVPAFTGLGFPHWAPTARAAIVGLTAQSDRRYLIRAALESSAYQIRDALDALRHSCAAPLRSLHVDGGPSANRFLMQFISDLCGVELHVSPLPNAAAIGAAIAGGARICAAPATSYRPTPSGAAAAGTAYDGWRAALRQVLSTQRTQSGSGVPTASRAQ